MVVYGRDNGITGYDARTDTSQNLQYMMSNAAATGAIIMNGFIDNI